MFFISYILLLSILHIAFTPDGMNQFGLADVKGEPWRKMKRQLTPSFSVPRLKKNVETMNEVANQLTGYLQSIENREYVEVIDFTKKYFFGENEPNYPWIIPENDFG